MQVDTVADIDEELILVLFCRNGRQMTDLGLEQTLMNSRLTRRTRGDEGTHWRWVSIFGGVLKVSRVLGTVCKRDRTVTE